MEKLEVVSIILYQQAASHFIQEAVEFRQHPRKFDRGRGFSLSQSWY
jgi:hypothetical protein